MAGGVVAKPALATAERSIFRFRRREQNIVKTCKDNQKRIGTNVRCVEDAFLLSPFRLLVRAGNSSLSKAPLNERNNKGIATDLMAEHSRAFLFL